MTCRHLGTCGGCALTLPYDAQLERKRARLSQLLGLPGVDVPPLVPSPRTEGFRQKAAFTFGITCSAISSIERRASAGSAQSWPA